jgi:hypothetical protein
MEFETTIPVFEQATTVHALDGAATITDFQDTMATEIAMQETSSSSQDFIPKRF